MAWSSQTQRETDNWETKEKWHEGVFRPRRANAPDFLENEKNEHFRKRLMERARPFVTADLQEVKTQDLYGSALDHYEQRYLESAAKEAQRPTNIEPGTLKEVTKYDASGRPFFEYFGEPKVWMSQFTYPAKKLIGIRGDGTRFVKP